VVEDRAGRHAQRNTVQLRPARLDGGKELVAHRIEHHRVRELGPVRKRNGDCVIGIAVHEIRGAVDRVDDPAPHRVWITPGTRTAFRAEHGVVGEGRKERCHDRVLRFRVCGGGDVAMLLGESRKTLQVMCRVAEDGGCVARGADGDRKRRIAHSSLL
jgi:hypothetical protein